MLKLLRNLLILAVLAVVGAKVYMWYETKQAADRIAAMADRFGDFSYGSVFATFQGEAGMRNVAFFPAEGLEIPPLVADAIVLKVPELKDMIELRAFFRGGPFPPSLSVQVMGWGGSAATGAYLPGFKPSVRSVSGDIFETFGCDTDEFSMADLRAMGYGAGIEPALQARYDFDALDNGLDLRLELSAPLVARWVVDADLSGVRTARELAQASVDELALSYEDLGFLERRNAYCADKINRSVSEYLTAWMAEVSTFFAERGIALSADLVGELLAFADGGESIRLTATDPDLSELESESWLVSLDPEISVAGAPAMFLADQYAEFEVIEEAEEETLVAAAPQPKPLRYVPVPLSQLDGFVDTDLRVETITREYRGTLVEHDPESLTLRVNLPGGEALVPIQKSTVKRVIRATR